MRPAAGAGEPKLNVRSSRFPTTQSLLPLTAKIKFLCVCRKWLEMGILFLIMQSTVSPTNVLMDHAASLGIHMAVALNFLLWAAWFLKKDVKKSFDLHFYFLIRFQNTFDKQLFFFFFFWPSVDWKIVSWETASSEKRSLRTRAPGSVFSVGSLHCGPGARGGRLPQCTLLPERFCLIFFDFEPFM